MGSSELEKRGSDTRIYQPMIVRTADMSTGSNKMQYMAAGAANLGILALGMTMGWTSPTTPKLKDPDQDILDQAINDDQESWIGALIALGAAISPLYSGYAADTFGRRLSILASGIPILIGWILIATAKQVGQIYAARVIFGFAVGQLFCIVPMYVGEIAEAEIRGALGSFLQMFIVIGFLFSYGIGPYVSYLVLVIVSVIPAIIFMIAFFFMPDSPASLLKRGKKSEALRSLATLKGKSVEDVQEELNALQASQEQNSEAVKISDLWTSKGNFKALYLSCGLVAFQQLSGINVVLFFMEIIFESANTGLPASISTIIIGVVQVLASSVTPLVVDRLGRRLLLLVSASVMTLSLAALGAFFYLVSVQSPAVSSISWLPVASLVIFMCVYCIGFGPLPWAVMGELFEPNIKSLASTIATTFCWIIAFLITKFFSSIRLALGMHFAFWIFGIFTFSAFLFVYFLLPETKGKSLEEIQDILNGRKPTKNFS